MKGVKKCYGLLLALAIIFGLSLNVSSDASALKYAYNSYPLIKELYANCSNHDSSDCNSYQAKEFPSFVAIFDAPSSLSYDNDLTDPSVSSFTYCNSDPSSPSSYQSIFQTTFDSDRSRFTFGSRSYFRKNFLNSNNVSCIPYTTNHYSFDSIYSSSYNLSNGDTIELVSIPQLFFDSEDSSYNSGSLKYLLIPLTIDYDSIGVIPSGTLLEWDFGLVQKSANNFSYLDTNLHSSLDVQFFASNPSSDFDSFFYSFTDDTASCTNDFNYRFQTRSNELWEDYLGFNIHCSYTAPSDMYYVHPILKIYGGSTTGVNYSTFLSYDYHGLYFTGSYFTTNGDSTWSGQYANPQPSGIDIESSPGYHQLYGYDLPDYTCAEGDFGCILENLFRFNFANPFAPIFDMFSSGSDCVNIPTLAGMLHSDETQVCPWFDSNTRSIVTPVLSISSMMLVFGFAVHWLGARSGNLFEDSVETDNYSFSNKFRRKK